MRLSGPFFLLLGRSANQADACSFVPEPDVRAREGHKRRGERDGIPSLLLLTHILTPPFLKMIAAHLLSLAVFASGAVAAPAVRSAPTQVSSGTIDAAWTLASPNLISMSLWSSFLLHLC